KSALLPIVGKDVQATRVSIYNEGVQAKFPLLGLRFKNSSGLHLMQGPITVFEGSNYAGDARILDLQPNEERLLSYAIDLASDARCPRRARATASPPRPPPGRGGGGRPPPRAGRGVLNKTRKRRGSGVCPAKNGTERERPLPADPPARPDFGLVDGKPAETA